MNDTLNKPLKSYAEMLIAVALAAVVIATVAFFVTRKSRQTTRAAETHQTQPISNPAADGGGPPNAGGAPDNKTSGGPASDSH